MSRTMFCDTSGARSLLLARDTAVAVGAELRLVITTAEVLRALSILGFDQILRIYPSLVLALTAAPAPPGSA
jgi:anti-anti-sigma regulatory factor